jgi:NAD(P)-dependent dehydrogenase (short-subunit alcohol dehydrogenase family)
VVINSRKADDLRAARADVEALAPGRRVIDVAGDIASVDDVTRMIDACADAFGRLDVIVCNAGVFGAKGRIEDVAWDEWEYGIATNLLGTVMCIRRALPLLRRSSFRPKIVITAGGGAERAHPYISAYGASKAGLVRFGECLALQLAPEIDVNMFLPGRLATRMVDEVIAAGPERVGQYYYDDFVELRKTGGASPENAAGLAVFLGSDESNGITGRLLHAVRDSWRTLATHAAELAPTDVYTLRRVEPKDRGFAWDT